MEQMEQMEKVKQRLQQFKEDEKQEEKQANEMTAYANDIIEKEGIVESFIAIEKLEKKIADFKENIKNKMREYNVKKVENDFLSITYMDETVRTSFDVKKFREEYPEVVEKYMKTSTVSDRIMVKLKKGA